MKRYLDLVCALALAVAAQHARADFDCYVLALSWQPAFCNTHRDKPECKTQKPQRFDANSLALHGLWPNSRSGPPPGWCGVPANLRQLDEDKKWCDLPDIGLGRLALESLSTVMPGVQSCLQNHEWYKHGTCSDVGPNQYSMEARVLVHKTSATRLGEFLAGNIDKRVPVDAMLNAFEKDFGKGSRRSLQITCEKAGRLNYLSEIRIALNKDRLSSRFCTYAHVFPHLSPPPRAGEGAGGGNTLLNVRNGALSIATIEMNLARIIGTAIDWA